jgi:hypothetical protein
LACGGIEILLSKEKKKKREIMMTPIANTGLLTCFTLLEVPVASGMPIQPKAEEIGLAAKAQASV